MSIRSQSGAAYRRGKSPAVSVLHGLIVVLGLGTACFILGFFVIARLLPGGPALQAAQTAAAPPPQAAATAPPVTQAPPQARQPASVPVTNPQTPAQSQVGPTVEPVDDSGSDTQPDPANSSTTISPSDTSGQGNVEAAVPVFGRRRRRRSDAYTNPVQPAEAPDMGGTATNSPAASADTSQPVDRPVSGRYRVQLGVYSTREAAEQVSAQAGDKGYPASVIPYDTGGRTLYRVQYAVYRSRSRADAARRRLAVSGIDATVEGRR